MLYKYEKLWLSLLVQVPFNAESGRCSEFEASMIYKVSSRTTRTLIQKNPVMKNRNQETEGGGEKGEGGGVRGGRKRRKRKNGLYKLIYLNA